MQYYIVDAFADKVFEGNPAGVCVVESWPLLATMQQIAFENNLSETAFVMKAAEGYNLRWFTPTTEVDLCGHATLATAYVIAKFVEPVARELNFMTRSGRLRVLCLADGLYELDFPALECREIALPTNLAEALRVTPREVYLSRDLLLLLDSPAMVAAVSPDFAKLLTVKEGAGVIVTAAGGPYDFVSRVFFPKMGINEDPVCGSAHCSLIPFWAERLGRKELTARQISQRGGTLYCRHAGDRVKIGGKAALYLKGEVFSD